MNSKSEKKIKEVALVSAAPKRKSLAIELGMICLGMSMAASVSATPNDPEVNAAAGEQPAAQMSQASDAPAPEVADDKKIVQIQVTAQKRSQAINKVGMPISAFSGDQLKDKGVASSVDLSAVSPGLTVNEGRAPIFTLRGVGFNDFATASSSTVGLYLDEVSLPYSVMAGGAMFDLERVEVLKGPQGDLFGRNTTAGQINFISARPTRQYHAGLGVDYSRFGVATAEGYVSGPLAESLLGRVSIKATQSVGSNGWQHSISRPGDRLGQRDALAARTMFNWRIADNATANVKLHYIRDSSDNIAPTAYDGKLTGKAGSQVAAARYPATPYFSVGDNQAADWSPDFRPRKDNELKGASVKLDVDLSESLTLTSLTAYDKFVRDDKNNYEGLPFEAGNVRNGSDIGVFSQELRLTSKDSAALSWIAGLYYSRDTVGEDYKYFFKDSNFGTQLGINNIDTRYDQNTRSIAAFGHAEWQFADKLKLVAGSRFTDEKRAWSGCTYDSGDGSLAKAWNNVLTPFTIVANKLPNPGTIGAGACAVYDDIAGTPNYGKFAVFSDEISTARWQGKLGLDFQADKNILFYTNLSQGFKSGGFNGAAAQTHSQLQAYKLEKLTALEAGFKAALFGQRAQLNGSVFSYDYRDKQEKTAAVTPVGNITGLTNIPKSRVKGAEFELMANLGGGFTQSLNLAYLSTNVIEYMAVSPTSRYPNVILVNAAGQNLPNAPRWQASETTSYEQNLAGGLRMTTALDVNFKSAVQGSTQDPLPAYNLVNVRLGIGDQARKWSVTLYGRNVFNKYYYTATGSGNTAYLRLNGMPVTYGVMGNLQF